MNNYNDNFLNLLEYPLDSYQEKALKTTKNAVIAAGAGSGKTQVLATRFAWLIMTEQAKVDEILTLTFTKKAAAEMYQRIYQTLYMFANSLVSENLTEKQKNLAKNALNNFANTHIQTLDSYCGSILRQCANRYGIKPDFTTGSADSERQVKDQAFLFILQNTKNLAVQSYAEAGSLQDFAENIFASIILNYTSIATPENFFKTSLEKQVQVIVDEWNNKILGNVENSIGFFVSEIHSAFEDSKKIDDKEKKLYKEQLLKFFETATLLKSLPKLTVNDVISNSDNLKENIKCYYKVQQETLCTHNFPGHARDISTHVTKLNKAFEVLDLIPSYINEYDSIKALNELLDAFLKQVNNSKRISGNLTFNDVSELTLKVLLENEDIRNQEKNAYSKIMIDEFQDNNGKNRDLLYLISLKPGEFENNNKCKIEITPEKTLHEQIIVKDRNGKIIEDKRSPEKLFFVGDEKQSIYKFRGAEVSVFNELTANNENELVQMLNNYRSTKELVKAFNVLFKNGNVIFSDKETGAEKLPYEAYYDFDAHKKDTELPELTSENIPIHAVCLKENDIDTATEKWLPANDQLAYDMAQRIYDMAWKNQNWGDFAILARSRTHYQIITKYLNLFGIPYNVDQQTNIFSDGIINDFYNFLRICVYPSDVNAMAAYFASPLCGISENGTEIIISYLNESEDGYNFKFELSDKYDTDLQKALTKIDFERFCNARKYFEETRKQVLCQKITSTLTDLWHNKGYKYEAIITKQIELNAEHFDMLFELARQADEAGKTASWFIDQLDMLKSKWSSKNADLDTGEINYPVEKASSVSIMTIHKSKGLEFKHVFLFGCTNYSSKGEKSLYFYDEETGVSIKTEDSNKNYFALRNKEIAKKKELAEFRRVIYVGVTRAVQDLYIMCKYKIPKEANSSGSSSSSDSSTVNFKLFETALIDKYGAITDDNYPFIPTLGFDYIKIKPVTYLNIIHKQKENVDKIRENILTEKKQSYENAEQIIFEQHPIPRSTPSSLEPDFVHSQAQDADSGEKYELSEDVLQNANFTAADFGTLVHAYLEAQANGISPEDFEPEPKYLKNLSDKDIQENISTCIKMCKEFSQSEPGLELETAKNQKRFYRAEWAFRMYLNGTIFTGSIDLIYQNEDGSFTIVDYKSDNQIDENKYIEQQNCYRTAASKMLKISEDKIQLKLYFLRHNKVIVL